MCVVDNGVLLCPLWVVRSAGDSLLSDARLKADLVNDVMELEAFLMQRRVELMDEDNVAFVGQSQGAPAAFQQQSLGAVGRWDGRCE
jgi:hypothetical protein